MRQHSGVLRLRRPLLIGIIGGLLLVAGAIAATGARFYESNDFFCLWSGARIVLHGDSPYNRATWAAATGGLHPSHDGTLTVGACTARYAYPLWTAVALLPVGALPLGLAAGVWAALAIAATIVGTAAAWRAFDGPPASAPLLAALVVGSQPFWLLLVGGQITGVLLGLAGLSAAALARRRFRSAGALVGALVLKPQLALFLLPSLSLLFAMPRARRRFVTGVLAVLALFVGVAFARDPGWLGPWLGEVFDRTSGLTPRLATLWGFADDVLGTSAWAVPLIVLCAAGAAMLVRRVALTPALWFALLIPWSLAAAPHAWSYDHLLLVVPWAATLACATQLPGRQRVLILLALAVCASLLPWLLYVVAFARGQETLSVAVPVASLFLIAYAVRAASPFGRAAAAVVH